MCMYVCVCMYVHVCVCMYVCVCVGLVSEVVWALAVLQEFACTAPSACLVHRHPGSAR